MFLGLKRKPNNYLKHTHIKFGPNLKSTPICEISAVWTISMVCIFKQTTVSQYILVQIYNFYCEVILRALNSRLNKGNA
jgi:hypothetical protein